ncbi:MAG: hypothetical protein K8R36_14865 [Planctomycetales bacterium]|nr:hypothetical protein [Planctomycetales bacterium]
MPTAAAAQRGDFRTRAKQFALIFVVLGWGIGIGTGSLALWNYSGTPGKKLPGAAVWPADTKLHRQSGSQTLVLFAHPHCPCTRATLRELERLAAQASGTLDIRVAFVQPSGTSADWAHTDLWQAAAAIPGVTVVLDHHGLEAHRFGARTSGETFLYDSTGRLVFQGGITPARGHEGESAGKSAIACWVTGHSAEANSPVFGCPLRDSDPSPKAE